MRKEMEPTMKLRAQVSPSVRPSSHASVMGRLGKHCAHNLFTITSGAFSAVDHALRAHSHNPMVVRNRIVAVGLRDTHFFCTHPGVWLHHEKEYLGGIISSAREMPCS